MLSLALKSKAALVLLTAAVASGGAITGILLTGHRDSAASASVPLPEAPPSQSPAVVSPDNAQALTAGYPQAGAPAVPTAAPPYTAAAPAAGYAANPSPAYVQYAPAAPVRLGLNSAQLDELLGPVALYPDPLLAELLPASTYPDQLAAAALFLRTNPNPPEFVIQSQPWEPSIRALAHSPSVLVWMYNNPDWTRTLGTAFTYEPQDVMNSIQRLRAMAMSAGSLIDTPQQTIILQDRVICIEPATVDVLYVPVYDWHTCYTRRYEPTFFVGAHIGGWLDNDCDWDDDFITVGARWDLGWDHRWDHDSDARRVTVRTARDPVVNRTAVNRTTVNITVNDKTVNKSAEVRVGGTQWKRNDARPAPTLPAKLAPLARNQPAAQPNRPAPPPVPAAQPDHNPRDQAIPDRGNSGRGNPKDANPDSGSDRGNRGRGRGN
jgi:hypothetical protein